MNGRGAGPALVVENLSVHYGGVYAVRDVSFTVPAGQAVGVIGANGAGKTFTLKAVLGLVPRTSTVLRYGDTDLTRVRARDMVRHGIGYVPEGRHVFAGLSVEKNLLLGAYARPWNGPTRSTLAEVYDLFRSCARCATGWPARCPAASSRCSPSAGR